MSPAVLLSLYLMIGSSRLTVSCALCVHCPRVFFLQLPSLVVTVCIWVFCKTTAHKHSADRKASLLCFGAVCFTNSTFCSAATFSRLQSHSSVYSEQTLEDWKKVESIVKEIRKKKQFSCTPLPLHIKFTLLVSLQVLLFLQAKTEEEHAATQMIVRLPEGGKKLSSVGHSC